MPHELASGRGASERAEATLVFQRLDQCAETATEAVGTEVFEPCLLMCGLDQRRLIESRAPHAQSLHGAAGRVEQAELQGRMRSPLRRCSDHLRGFAGISV